MFKQRGSRPITYQEAHDELMSTYDELLDLNTGENNVGLSDVENPLMGSLLEIWMSTYVREQIGEIFKISFDDFLLRPRWEMMKMLEVAKRRTAELKKTHDSVIPEDWEKQLQGRL